MRKTIAIRELLIKVNHLLSLTMISQEEKKTLCVLIEDVLHDAGQYNGFLYLRPLWDVETKTYQLQEEFPYNREYFMKKL